MAIKNCPEYSDFQKALYACRKSILEEYIEDFSASFDRETAGKEANLNRLHIIFKHTSSRYAAATPKGIDLASKKNKIKNKLSSAYIPGIQIWLGLYDPTIALKWFNRMGKLDKAVRFISPPRIDKIIAFEKTLSTSKTLSELDLFIPEKLEDREWTSFQIKFSQKQTEFIGRVNEYRELKTFVDANVPFCWWQIAGTAGQGKSRIALKLIEELKLAGWEAGFIPKLNDAFIESVRQFNNRQPVLMVVDYASDPKRSILIGDLIYTLSKISEKSSHAVRLLIIDRHP